MITNTNQPRFVPVRVDKYLGDYTGRYLAWAIADRQHANRTVSRKYDSYTECAEAARRMEGEQS